MKFGFRVPSLKKRFAARTSWKRVVRHSLGLKAPRGWGWLTNPRKAAYNRGYNRTSFDIFKTAKRAVSGGKLQKSAPTTSSQPSHFSSLVSVIRGLVVIGILIVGVIFVLGIIAALFSDKPSTTTAQSPRSIRPAATTSAAVVPPLAVPTTTTPPTTTIRFTTAAEAQQAAVRRYPALGVAGSTLNTAFVARYKLYQQQRPEYFRDNSWPMRLAEEVVPSVNPK